MTRRLLTVAAIGVSVVGFGALGTAEAGNDQPEVVEVNPSSVIVGDQYEVSVSGFDNCGATDLAITIQPQGGTMEPLGTVPGADLVADPIGAAGPFPFVAPSTPGTYIIDARYAEECADSAAAQLVVRAPETTTTSTTTTTTTTTTVPDTTAPTTAAPTTTDAAAVPPAPTTAAPTAPPVGLPATGSTSGELVWIAIASLLGGLGLVVVAARRA